MWNIFLFQWKRLFKRPALIIMFFGLTVLFVYFMGSAEGNSTINVPVYTESLSEEEFDQWVDNLNEDDSIVFEQTDRETAVEDLRMNKGSIAVEISAEDYKILVSHENEQLPTVDQHVNQVYRKQIRLENVKKEFPDREIILQEFIQVNNSASTAFSSEMDYYQIFVLVGMTLYFTMFNILYLLNNLIVEKITGTWNRLIFSPVSKVKIYLGHLLFYILAGVIQILLSFYVLTSLLNINLSTNYFSMASVALAYIFSVVSLGILLIALVPSPSILSVVIPIVSTGMAMLGGAFWPIDIVSNKILLFLGDLTPMRHGIEGMTAAIHSNAPINELMHPIGILLLMGILFIGIGINLMERPSENTL